MFIIKDVLDIFNLLIIIGVFIMVLSLMEMKNRSKDFIDEYKDISDEKSYAQHFWRDFLHIFGIHWKDVAVFEQAVKKFSGDQGFIDCFWKGKVVIEHKTRGKSLNKAYTQALGYLDTLSSEEKPRYVIVSDFERIRLIDLYTDKKQEIHLNELTDNIQMFNFIYDDDNEKKHDMQVDLDIKASELMGELYDALKDDNYDEYDLELFLIRLLFCVYAEDTEIFDQWQVEEYIFNEEDITNIGNKIQKLFRTLDKPEDQRQNSLEDDLKAFPYVNGKLFETPIDPPSFNGHMINIMKKICNFNWSSISPAIFGSLFQSIINPELRRELGAHYTSESNILKVVNSLFMNDLWEEFYQAKGKRQNLEVLWDKIGKLEFFDPACGCGNFLIVAYKELRLLEYEILAILLDEDENQVRFNSRSISKIRLEHFHGIEIEEFPSLIAKLSMWLIQHQMDLRYKKLDIEPKNLPLNSPANIYHVNALEVDWKELIIPNDNLFILGNPPFAGKQEQTQKQKNEMKETFKGFKRIGTLDYVTAWYKKASEYIQGTNIECAFVSTNSICQGEQVEVLWKKLKEDYNIIFNFAHQSFKWSNEAKNNAVVSVIIIGFSCKERPEKFLFKYQSGSDIPQSIKVKKINSYLLEYDEIYISSKSKPICDVPEISLGNMPIDGGNLILNKKEKEELINKYPILSKYIKKYVGGDEFIKNTPRYCLWLTSETALIELKNIPEISERVYNVEKLRSGSTRKQTREASHIPSLFAEIRQPENDIIVIPLNTSSSREYVPMGILNNDIIISNLISFVNSNDLLILGILTSKMHMVWLNYIGGKLGNQYRYSNRIVYNNFPFPNNISEKDRNDIENQVKQILDIRDSFENISLFDLYDSTTMPPILKKAHMKLDKIIDKVYRKKSFEDYEDRIKFLFDLYLEYTSDN